MTILDCTVVNCTYNKDNSCKKENIMVEGDKAHVTSDTSCGSFEPKGCGCEDGSCGYNACDCASKETDVSCKAECCIYNHSKECDAEHIGIAGGHADHSAETECASFECE